MRLLILAAIVGLVAGTSSCNKDPQIRKQPDPAPTNSFTRTFYYPNQSTSKQAKYDSTYQIEARTSLENNLILLTFIAHPKTEESAGDAIAFHISASHLQTGLQKTYRFSSSTEPILACRYTYSYKRADGSTWASISDSKTGIKFDGSLTIDKYDADRKLISGTYSIEIKGLINDPTKLSIGAPIDSVNRCDVSVTGSFKNSKLQNL